MKRMLLAAALALGTMGQALAADIPPPTPAPLPPRAPAVYVPTVAPVYNWGGVYVGVNGGYGFGTSSWTIAPGAICAAGCASGNFSTGGGLVGGTIGANFQASQLVIGIEGDLDWAWLHGSAASGCGGIDVALGLQLSASCQTRNDWLGTVRGRVGYAFDRILVFGTAGGAFGSVNAIEPINTNTNTEVGWTAGGGVEFAFLQNWTAKVEYLFVDLSNASCTLACTTAAGVAPNPAGTIKYDTSLVRGGINFKFGGF